MKKLAGMAVAVLMIMAVMAPVASAGVGGAIPGRAAGATLRTAQLTIGAVAARSNHIPGVGGAEPEGVGGARPTGVGGARPSAGGVAVRLSELPRWAIEILLRGALGR